MTKRLLLVEFAVVDRFHRAVLFPYLRSYTEGAGLTTRWVQFGLTATEGWRRGASLSSQDAETLQELIEDFRPSLLIFSHRPTEALSRAIAAGASAPKQAHIGASHTGVSTEDQNRIEELELGDGSIPNFLGLPTRGKGPWLIRDIAPTFCFEPVGAMAGRVPVLPFIFIGEECTFNLPYSRNPFLSDVPLEECGRKGGCSFCTRPPNQGSWAGDPMERLRGALEALRAISPPARDRLSVRLVGEPIIARIDEVASLVISMDLPPMDLMLDARADTFVGARVKLTAAIDILEGSDHKLSLALIGIESFSMDELQRLNKGLTPAQNIAAVEAMCDLESRFPNTFSFREHGGLSLIVATPWTTVDDVMATFSVTSLLGLEELSGKFFSGRLRLYPSLPLAAVARREGLLLEHYTDPLLDTAKRTFYEDELPWRSADPLLDELLRLLIRIPEEADTRADQLGRQVGALVDTWRKGGKSPLDLAVAMLTFATPLAWNNASSVPCAEDLVRELEALGPDLGHRVASADERWMTHAMLEQGTLFGSIPVDAWLDVKPVMKIEPLHPDDVAHWEAEDTLPNLTIRRRGGSQHPAAGKAELEIHEAFFGARMDDVSRAINTAAILDERGELAPWQAAAADMGRLLGYPSCCSHGFANEASGLRDHYFWLHVARRLSIEGPVPWQLNPGGELLAEYVPCGPTCAASVARAEKLLQAVADRDSTAADRITTRLQNPHLLIHDVQGTTVELIPSTTPGERFAYRAGARQGASPLLEAVIKGDEIVLGPTTISILREGRRYASLSGRAFLWWHEEAFQTDLWAAMISFKRNVIGLSRPATDSDESNMPPTTPGMRALDTLLTKLDERRASFLGFHIESWRFPRHEEVEVSLVHGTATIRLSLQERRTATRWMFDAGPFVVGHPKRSPLNSEEERRAAGTFAATIAEVYRRRAARRQ